MQRSLNYNALTLPVLRSDVRAFKAQSASSASPMARSRKGFWVGAGCAIAVLGLFLLGVDVVVMIGSIVALTQNPPLLIGIAGLVLPPLVTAGLVWLTVRSLLGADRRQWETWFRLERFAIDNGLVFSASSPNPQYPGLIFHQGSDRQTVNHVRSTTGRFLDIGNFQFTTSDGERTTTHQRGFMAFNLDRRLPHMVLDAKSNGSFGLAAFGRDQRLSLEGDFDRYFTLFCPRQYERDALYIFTPDLMALLIDDAAPFDVEIIDNWMFVYSNTAFPSLHPGLYARLFGIIDSVGAKTLTQSARYRDERVDGAPFAQNVVAPPGQRLRRRFSPAIVALIVLGALVVVPIVVVAIIALVVFIGALASGA